MYNVYNVAYFVCETRHVLYTEKGDVFCVTVTTIKNMVWVSVVYNISSFAYVKRLGMHIAHTIKHIHFYNSCGIGPFECNLKDLWVEEMHSIYIFLYNNNNMCLFSSTKCAK